VNYKNFFIHVLTVCIILYVPCVVCSDQKEPILSDFEKDTGIKVKAVYDVEASKTVGPVNRTPG